jgi:hypothetical protein
MKSKKYPESKPAPVEQSKVAEPVASYAPSVTTSVTKPKAKSRRIAGLDASDEVWNFAQKHRLVPHLETAVRLVKESFKNIRTMYLTFDPDPEEPKLDGIIIHITIGGATEEWENQYKVYALRFIEEIPNDIRSKICLFYY